MPERKDWIIRYDIVINQKKRQIFDDESGGIFFQRLIFSTNVVLFKFRSAAALFLFPCVLWRAWRIKSSSTPSSTSRKLSPKSGSVRRGRDRLRFVS